MWLKPRGISVFLIIGILCSAGAWGNYRQLGTIIVTKKSPMPVERTMDRFETIVKAQGMRVLTRIDYQEMAKIAGQTIRPNQVLIFGDPRISTRLIQENPESSLLFPLQVSVWEDRRGTVYISYVNPLDLGSIFDLKSNQSFLTKLSTQVDRATDLAIGAPHEQPLSKEL